MSALRLLADRGVTRVFSEGGPRVAAKVCSSPILPTRSSCKPPVKPLGRAGRPALTPAARAALEDDSRYRLIETRALGADTMTRYARVD